jgi:hypothetical protein
VSILVEMSKVALRIEAPKQVASDNEWRQVGDVLSAMLSFIETKETASKTRSRQEAARVR